MYRISYLILFNISKSLRQKVYYCLELRIYNIYICIYLLSEREIERNSIKLNFIEREIKRKSIKLNFT